MQGKLMLSESAVPEAVDTADRKATFLRIF